MEKAKECDYQLYTDNIKQLITRSKEKQKEAAGTEQEKLAA